MKTNFYYRVDELADTFGKDEFNQEPFTYSREFRDENPLKGRAKTFDWYRERMRWYDAAGGYFLPWGGVLEAAMGLASAHSLTMYLVVCNDQGVEIDCEPIMGEDEETMEESREMEASLFKKMGLDAPTYDLEYEEC